VDQDDSDVRPSGRLFQVIVAVTYEKKKVRSPTARRVVWNDECGLRCHRKRRREYKGGIWSMWVA